MAQLVKCLLFKLEDLKLGSQHPFGKLSVTKHGEVERGGSLELTGQLGSLSLEIRQRGIEEDT